MRTPRLDFRVLALAGILTACAFGFQQETIRPIPPPGIALSDEIRTQLSRGAAELGRAIEAFRAATPVPPALADVEVFHKAARYAVEHGELFAAADVDRARKVLEEGRERARQLAERKTPWLERPGDVVLGYVSDIDGSVQPYHLVVPAGAAAPGAHRFRLDAWFHGRNETLSEVNFIAGSDNNAAHFARPDAFQLRLYGRYCNANKFAGEVDLFEALEDVKRRFRIDDSRIVVRGFSMGGAATWHIAAHHASLWAAAAPGAGFAETPAYLKLAYADIEARPWWERKLWQLYDAPGYAANFANLPVVAYSGELDRQKQAADVMAAALAREGTELAHVIGPKTEHRYHADSIPVLNRLIDAIAARGREPVPRRVRLATPTLKYNRQAWVTVEALAKHWEMARVDAEIVDDRNVRVQTSGVTALTLSMPAGSCPLDPASRPAVTIDGAKIEAARILSDRSWTARFRRAGGRWGAVERDDDTLRKRHDLQGPIDDAFMSSFLFVRPTGTARNAAVDAWSRSELERAVREWRRQFRGDARIKDDRDVTDADVAAHNLVLWGDPSSNGVLGRIAERLPIRWSRDAIASGSSRFAADHHALVLVYPNPLNPKRYVVVNSGVTFREYDYLTNARQVPKLPDWAVIDLRTPPDARRPGAIAAADFFGERWELTEKEKP